ncbi:hypothetical protein RFI_37164 [Reticulomyxa filosa]|uniref:Uncharacterized protein n=1 Tax=Reticulomyxa filosa TaxID=46433 RepID=X6LFE1_RETFI|nr:hypothetical protein RFI_37164 [Reticulomyxa filosa]|eukprot:ETO00284.1 hypothetical protein RFI_37164 [Reticulomyxa filosa]
MTDWSAKFCYVANRGLSNSFLHVYYIHILFLFLFFLLCFACLCEQSLQGHDSIVCYQIDPKTALLGVDNVQWFSSGGHIPRHFNIDPSNQFLLCANQEGSCNISVFRIQHQRKGALEFVMKVEDTKCPACIQFFDICSEGAQSQQDRVQDMQNISDFINAILFLLFDFNLHFIIFCCCDMFFRIILCCKKYFLIDMQNADYNFLKLSLSF